MADEDITLDGKPLQSLRVADLKAALDQRNLPKSGQKNTLIKRLKGALMLENLQKSSSSHSGLQPNSQIGEEMCQNSFIKQYLAKQQELLRQKLEREAQQGDDDDESSAVPEEDEDHSEDNDSSSYPADKHHSAESPPAFERGGTLLLGSSSLLHQESPDDARKQRANFLQGLTEATAPSPPRAVASLSVRVVGQPDRQGLPPTVPRPQEKEGTAPREPGSAHAVLHLSRSAAGSHAQEDSDDGDDESDDDDDDWGPGTGGVRRANRAPLPPQQMAPSASVAASRSKRKLQQPQHIPPPQVHHTPMQLRHPTPPPSPPPNLFPLPDTPKQSPPDEPDGEGANAMRSQRVSSFPPNAMQRQDSDSSSGSSSPEPPPKRKPGPLSLLVHKMESEGAFRAAGVDSETVETAHSSSDFPQQGVKMSREEDKEQERKQLEEERKRRQKEELEEKERKRQEEEKEKKRQEEEKERNRQEEEKEKKRQEAEKERKRQEEEKKRAKEDQVRKTESSANKVIVTISQDSGSSSDSDSKSDSSSSSSSDSTGDKKQAAGRMKQTAPRKETEDERKTSKGAEKRFLPKREVSEPSVAAMTEVEPESEGSIGQQPASGGEPDPSEESNIPKALAARKISLSSSKTSPSTTDGGAAAEDAGSAAGRKRRWGSSAAVTAKKPSISITTESLKSLIPDIKVNQEAVVELHPDEVPSSGEEENLENNRDDPDKGLKIRRTVTQVVPGDGQENGQTNDREEEEEEEAEKPEQEKQRRSSQDTRKNSVSEDVSDMQTSVDLDGEEKKFSPSDSLVRRSISQQKSGVSVTIDDPVRATRPPSPPRGKVSNIIHVTNLVRPFTLGQLKELLNRTGSLMEEGFWIDKIKSHCYVTYATVEEAVATRTALHGVKWPSSNPKVLNVDFSEQDEVDFHKGLLKPIQQEELVVQPIAPPTRLPPLMPERDRERDRGVRDLWAEREREMQRRVRARGEREWDRDKVREFARPGEGERRSRSRERERRRRERAKSKERKSDKKEKGDEPPAKLLDDLFLKTKAAPCIYWLPLTEEQVAQRILDRTERQKERERRRKEQQEEEEKKREEEKKERQKGREKESAVSAGGGGGSVASGRVTDGDKRKDSGHRSRRASPGAGSGRRSRSRSNPRDRRR